MTKKQRDKIIAVIQEDANLAFNYCNGEGLTCVIGGLLKEAGYTKERLLKFPQEYISSILSTNGPTLNEARNVLEDHYGLTASQIREMQKINDFTTLAGHNFSTPETTLIRREKLIEYVKSLPDEPLD